jgi:multisubunit Na+/H+ antiporter MnhC subunit
MSAVPVFIPPVSLPPVAPRRAHLQSAPMPEVAQAVTTPIRWQLTDRGIAVVLLVVAMILTAAVIAIGVTAVRVTSADFDAGLHESRQAQR